MDINIMQFTIVPPDSTGIMINTAVIVEPTVLSALRKMREDRRDFQKLEAHQEKMKQPARWYDRHR